MRHVRVVVDFVRRVPVDGGASINPLPPIAPTDPQHWLVVHDTRGRVVVRDGRTTDRAGLSPTNPNDAQWQVVDAALAPLVAAASEQPPLVTGDAANQPPWTDDAPLHPAPVARATTRFHVGHKLWSLATTWTIKDGDGHDVYRATGQLDTEMGQLVFEDMAGKHLGQITRERVQSNVEQPPEYNVRCGKKTATVIYNKHDDRRPYDLGAEDGLHVHGNVAGKQFEIRRHGDIVASVVSESIIVDRYGIDIADGEDAAYLLAIVVAFEIAGHTSLFDLLPS